MGASDIASFTGKIISEQKVRYNWHKKDSASRSRFGCTRSPMFQEAQGTSLVLIIEGHPIVSRD